MRMTSTVKFVKIELNEVAILNWNIPVDSATPFSCLKQNVIYELIQRNSFLKILNIDRKYRAYWLGFNYATINIIGKIVIKLQSNEWMCDETPFFNSAGYEINILLKQKVPKMVIKIAKKDFFNQLNQPVISRIIFVKWQTNANSKLYKHYNDGLNRIGKIWLEKKNDPYPLTDKKISVQWNSSPFTIVTWV